MDSRVVLSKPVQLLGISLLCVGVLVASVWIYRSVSDSSEGASPGGVEVPCPDTTEIPGPGSETPPGLDKEKLSNRDSSCAGEAVRYWIAAHNYAIQTNDSAPLRKLMLDECVNCKKVADNFDHIKAENGRNEGGGFTVTDFERSGLLRSPEAAEPDEAVLTVTVSLTMDVREWIVYEADGREAYRGKVFTGRVLEYTAEHRGDMWKIREFYTTETGEKE